MFLRVIEAFIKWSLRISEFFETCRCFTERVGTPLQPFDGVGGGLLVLTHCPPLCTCLGHIPNS